MTYFQRKNMNIGWQPPSYWNAPGVLRSCHNVTLVRAATGYEIPCTSFFWLAMNTYANHWKFLDFDPIQAILGPSGITLGHILQAVFEDMGGYVFDFDLINTILWTPGTTLRHLTEYFWSFWQMHAWGGGGGGVKCEALFGHEKREALGHAPLPPPPPQKPPLGTLAVYRKNFFDYILTRSELRICTHSSAHETVFLLRCWMRTEELV